jgi:hypothetical protein
MAPVASTSSPTFGRRGQAPSSRGVTRTARDTGPDDEPSTINRETGHRQSHRHPSSELGPPFAVTSCEALGR